MIRRFALLALFCGLTLLALTCGSTPTPKCQRSNCSGCCTADNKCLGEGAQSDAGVCGANGAACAACAPGHPCVNMVCSGTGGGGGSGGAGGQGGGTAGGTGGGGPCGAVGEACCGTTCDPGLSCSRSQCQPIYDAGPCGGNAEPCCNGTVCINPYSCQGGTCRSAADAGADGGALKGVGEACANSSECVDGLCQIVGNFVGGYCTKTCTSQANCPVGSQCSVNPSGGANLCLRDCSPSGSAPGSCRSGYICEKAHSSMSGSPVCTAACQSLATCGTAPTCDPRGFCCGAGGYACCSGSVCNSGSTCTSGYCVTTSCGALGQSCCTGSCTATGTVCSGSTCVACGGSSQPCCAGNTCTVGTCTAGTCQGSSLVPAGGPCTGFAQCQGNVCITPSGNLWVGGYCTQDCSASVCPIGASCSQGYLFPPNSVCGANCVFDGGAGGCRSGYVCELELIPLLQSQGLCSPACTNTADCGGLPCQSGFCCGAVGYRCCSGNTCNSGGTCQSNGYCG